jgi:outer membrane lipoprotein-sorting protein
MRRFLLALAGLLCLSAPAAAQNADEIVAKFIKTVGGMERIQAVKSLRRTGKFTGGGGFEAVVVEENKRPNLVRQEFQIQGMTGITAYDGKSGWKIEPWNGKKDAEALSEEELKGIIEDSDLDGPLVNYKEKGIMVEYVGMDEVEGTDAYKLKVTMKNGDVRFYYMDTDYFVPIKIDTKRMIRGAEREFETILGDYKEVDGWYLPFSVESGLKGSQNRSKVTYEKIEANVSLDDSRFHTPVGAGAKTEVKAPDASETAPKQSEEKKSGEKPPAEKPPVSLGEK